MVTSQVFSSFKTSFAISRRLPSNGKANQQQQQQQQQLPSTSLQAPKESNDDKTELVAMNMILLEPKEPDGYLLAGKLYEKQGRRSAARVIYADSLTQVPLTDPHYPKLQLALKKLDLQRASFVSLFSYDVSCIIFSELKRDDLIQCTGVCQAWSHFMLQWPRFWDLLDGVIDRATIDSILDGKNDQFHIRGEMDDMLLTSMIQFLVASGARNIKDIELDDMSPKKEHIYSIVNAVKSCTSSVERMTLKDIYLGNPARVLLDIHCPRLKDLVSTYASWEMPTSAEYTEDFFAGKEGLKRFLFSSTEYANRSITTSDVVPVFKVHHKTLSTLYLHFDRKVIDTRFIFLLARYGMPQLRQLYLCTENRCRGRKQYTDRRNPSFSKAIAALATRCPQLRILQIQEGWLFGRGELPLDKHAILAIFNHCRFLKQLNINTTNRHINEDDLTAARVETLKSSL
ncbi:hypothetical protein K492DRAFT_239015 [Lichtheimia hyalospora FSU 10163]|nr:hypothetical protein K492DRAFT_239015 [Lichtheimia hyalospora FSU 10163]